MDEKKIARNMRRACRNLCAEAIDGIVAAIVAHQFCLISRNRTNCQQVFGHPSDQSLVLLFDPCTHNVSGRYLPAIIVSRRCGEMSFEIDRREFVCVLGSDITVIIDDATEFLDQFIAKILTLQEVRRVA